ncbi:hypothetical protein [Clostridium sp. Marseille-Q2269]|nr:hypothetical protein [Clostridium sp. Marseille-Q2269]
MIKIQAYIINKQQVANSSETKQRNYKEYATYTYNINGCLKSIK